MMRQGTDPIRMTAPIGLREPGGNSDLQRILVDHHILRQPAHIVGVEEAALHQDAAAHVEILLADAVDERARLDRAEADIGRGRDGAA